MGQTLNEYKMKTTTYIILLAALSLQSFQAISQDSGSGRRILENGVILPSTWPPEIEMNYSPMNLPYLKERMEVLPIDRGRQLFVDGFLIESTNLERVAHKPEKLRSNPVLYPETELEKGIYGNPGATAKDGGIWWDPKDGVFKMWYEAGWLYRLAYAYSYDGLHWIRPELDVVPGTNQVIENLFSDSSTIWLDHDTDNPEQRFKMFFRSPNSIPGSDVRYNYGWCMTSPDGIHWSEPVKTGPCGDRSTIFYNPFLKKWVYSLRNSGNVNKIKIGRYRNYHEHEDFLKGAEWSRDDLHFWLGADSLDKADPYIGDRPQLYNLSAVAYESIMVALPQIHLGPGNEVCRERGIPKITELKIAYSRDGFHWDRTDRDTFIAAERKEGSWDRGYVQSCGGLFTIVGDKLWFYYIGFRGGERISDTLECNSMHYGGSTGIAVLRRDGFVSLSAGEKEGYVTTRPVKFNGKWLFVNVDCPEGMLKAEILDIDGNVLEGYSADRCIPVSDDSTIRSIRWKGKKNLADIAGMPVRFRFYITGGDLYSFWVSPSENGESNGYSAAGGPGFTGSTDTEGIRAYKVAEPYNRLIEELDSKN